MFWDRRWLSVRILSALSDFPELLNVCSRCGRSGPESDTFRAREKDGAVPDIELAMDGQVTCNKTEQIVTSTCSTIIRDFRSRRSWYGLFAAVGIALSLLRRFSNVAIKATQNHSGTCQSGSWLSTNWLFDQNQGLAGYLQERQQRLFCMRKNSGICKI